MKSKILASGALKTWIVVFQPGDEVASGLSEFARREKLSAGQFSAIGAFQSAVLGYFNYDEKDYDRIELNEQVEVLSLLGDVTLHHGEPKVHAHVVLGKRDGTAWGGHLLKAIVRPTLEVIVSEAPAHLCKQHDPQTGLALIDPTQRCESPTK